MHSKSSFLFLLFWVTAASKRNIDSTISKGQRAVWLFSKWANRITCNGDLRKKETQTHRPLVNQPSPSSRSPSNNSCVELFPSNGIGGHCTSPVFAFPVLFLCLISKKLCYKLTKSQWFHGNQQHPAGFAGETWKDEQFPLHWWLGPWSLPKCSEKTRKVSWWISGGISLCRALLPEALLFQSEVLFYLFWNRSLITKACQIILMN